MANANLIPATILTGFLGAGKTTLLNRILTERHGEKIAVIENEFGAEGIDNEILVQDRDEQIVEMNNGCICCTVRGDLVRILSDLAAKRKAGELKFDRVIIETTGMAEPGPVAQSFFMDDDIHEQYVLDAVLTVVDAKHGNDTLTANGEARAQVGFADRILISKTDLIAEDETKQLMERLRRMNPRAAFHKVNFGTTDLKEILDIRGFNLNGVLEIDPTFLTDDHHTHSDDVQSFVWKDARPLDMEKIEAFLSLLIQTYGVDMLRYKGVLNIEGQQNRMIFQGVHMLMGTAASYYGELQAALDHLDSAQEVDPLFPAIRANRGVAYYFAGQFDEANGVFIELLTEYPQRTATRVSLASSLTMCGGFEAARNELNAVIEHDPDDSGARLALAIVNARDGDKRQAKKIVNAVRASSDIEKTNPTALAGAYAQLAEVNEAMKWLALAADSHEGGFAEVQVDPLLAPLVGVDAFRALLSKYGLSARQMVLV